MWSNWKSNEDIFTILNTPQRIQTNLNNDLYKSNNSNEQISIVNTSEQRTVIIKFHKAGYGNNMYKILTSFMYAIITDSNLVINWPHIEPFIEPPFKNAFRKIEDLNLTKDTKKIYSKRGFTKNSWNPNKRLILNETLSKNFINYYVTDIAPYFFDLCANPMHFDKLIKHRLVKPETIHRALNSLDDDNIVEQQRIEYFQMIGFEYAGSILNNYWRLNKRMQEKVDDFYRHNFEGAFVIGMQLRFEYLNMTDVETFLNCARNIEYKLDNQKPVKWYVSSDYADFVRKIKSKHEHKILTAAGYIGHVNLNNHSYERAILDIELLSRCDELIFTGGSTFGFMAALINQRRPYYINGRVNMRTCERLKFFSPPKTSRNESVF